MLKFLPVILFLYSQKLCLLFFFEVYTHYSLILFSVEFSSVAVEGRLLLRSVRVYLYNFGMDSLEFPPSAILIDLSHAPKFNHDITLQHFL